MLKIYQLIVLRIVGMSNNITLYDAIKKVIKQFGHNILTEKKIINILSDYGAFKTLQATKTILKNMVENGFCQKVCDLGKKKRFFLFSGSNSSLYKPDGNEWNLKLSSLATNIAQQGGFEKNIVTYVIDCITYGLGWIEEVPSLPQTLTNNYQKHPDATNNVASKARHQVTTDTKHSLTTGITYQPIKDTQFVVVNIKPYNAEVFIDGIQQYVVNGIMVTELSVGKHEYEIRASSYKSQSGSFCLASKDKTILTIQLEPEEKKIELSIITNDKDAEIWINGSVCGQGIWNGLIDAGEVQIECSKPKYYSYTETRVLGTQQKVKIQIPPLAPICGNLKINVQPYGSEIFINGESKGTTPLLVTGITIGIRALHITTPEGVDYYTNVEVREGQVTNVNHIIPSLFLDDYSDVKIGDYFYEDGSVSHMIAKGKEIVGIVFSLETSEEEKKHGWTHGQIIAIDDAKQGITTLSSWGIPTDEIMQFAVKYPNKNNQSDNGYEISHQNSVINNEDFAPFYIASKYNVPLPFRLTSGWYLPSIKQWKTLYENTHPYWDKLWRYLKLINQNGVKDFATSSIMNKEFAWIFTMGFAEEYKENSYSAKDIKIYLGNNIRARWRDDIHVRCVAAF